MEEAKHRPSGKKGSFGCLPPFVSFPFANNSSLRNILKVLLLRDREARFSRTKVRKDQGVWKQYLVNKKKNESFRSFTVHKVPPHTSSLWMPVRPRHVKNGRCHSDSQSAEEESHKMRPNNLPENADSPTPSAHRP